MTFVDNNYHSVKLIKENLQRINAERDTCQCYKANALHFLEDLKRAMILFLRTLPYGLDIPEEFFLPAGNICGIPVYLCWNTPQKKPLPPATGSISATKKWVTPPCGCSADHRKIVF
ncbi:MAG: hypothetical protein U5N56_10915 [Candidatus Marinimicrobia bacterium]|nr:hypothetical protein [Candidatus Neomarinimicrobiota bacterium]